MNRDLFFRVLVICFVIVMALFTLDCIVESFSH